MFLIISTMYVASAILMLLGLAIAVKKARDML